MPSQKRSREAVDGTPEEPEHLRLLHSIRNMWQFANLAQWIYIFGKAAKIDEAMEDIEDLEAECLKPKSSVLDDVALAILKLVSSHRGLTHDIFDDQARKAYQARLPDHNPFGHDDDLQNFRDFDIFTKIRVLQQLTQWAMSYPERIRDKMEEQKDLDQTSWRIEPYGWDSQDRTYYVLDDNRVYRLTEPPPPQPKPKQNKRRKFNASRRSKARRRNVVLADETEQEDTAEPEPEPEPEDDGFGGMVWECVAVSLEDVRTLLGGLKKTRDENEKVLRAQLTDHLVPILEKQEEARKRKEQQRERELLNLAKMATAKRSSRIADKSEQKKREEEEKEELRIARQEETARRREEQKRVKLEKERDFRLFSREKRLHEREARRRQHEEELAELSQDNGNDQAPSRVSERHVQGEIEKKRQALKELEEEEEDWVFDCICGMYGRIDDGTHSVACEKCSVWQHSKCLGVSEEEAERPEFHFVCSTCIRREKEAKERPKTTIKLKVNRPGSSDRPPSQGEPHGAGEPKASSSLVVELPAIRPGTQTTIPTSQLSPPQTSGASLVVAIPSVTPSSAPRPVGQPSASQVSTTQPPTLSPSVRLPPTSQLLGKLPASQLAPLPPTGPHYSAPQKSDTQRSAPEKPIFEQTQTQPPVEAFKNRPIFQQSQNESSVDGFQTRLFVKGSQNRPSFTGSGSALSQASQMKPFVEGPQVLPKNASVKSTGGTSVANDNVLNGASHRAPLPGNGVPAPPDSPLPSSGARPPASMPRDHDEGASDKLIAKTPTHVASLPPISAITASQMRQPAAGYERPLETPWRPSNEMIGSSPRSDMLPPGAGPSPIKQSPTNSDSFASVKSTSRPVIPPVASLHPSPRQTILTPPVKPAKPVTSPDDQNGSS